MPVMAAVTAVHVGGGRGACPVGYESERASGGARPATTPD